MKKKLLPLAMLAGLVGTAGTAEAVYLNSDGLGETLIYPFYSVEGGQDTYFSVVNTTNETKAVKVRIIEAMNSAEVLDFNLYLSPEDHWAGTITITDDGAKLLTSDNSCTVPAIPAEGVALRDIVYNIGAYDPGQTSDGGPTSLDRTREGYIEILEMGVLDDLEVIVNLDGAGNPVANFGAEAAALHGADGMPSNCDTLVNAWIAVGSGTGTGQWAVSDINGNALPILNQGNPSANFDNDLDRVGGLYGYGTIVNVDEGTNATYSAVALDAFFATTPQHTDSGFVTPSLGGANAIADIFDSETGLVVALDYLDGWDAVSAVFMHDSISNDYLLEPGLAAGTDWVVTMPTKRNYVNVVAPADQPFLEIWDAGQACEEVQIEHWNREEQTTLIPPTPGGVDFSPRPPVTGSEPVGFALCTEVSVVSFYHPDDGEAFVDAYVSALQPSERIQYGFPTEHDNGWARMTMGTDNGGTDRVLSAFVGPDLIGLPAIGFAVQKFSNGNVGGFYAGLIEHKYTRDFN